MRRVMWSVGQERGWQSRVGWGRKCSQEGRAGANHPSLLQCAASPLIKAMPMVTPHTSLGTRRRGGDEREREGGRNGERERLWGGGLHLRHRHWILFCFGECAVAVVASGWIIVILSDKSVSSESDSSFRHPWKLESSGGRNGVAATIYILPLVRGAR